MVASAWAAQHGDVDRYPAQGAHIRCSDAEREPVVDSLKQAYAEGRLDSEEFELRVHLAMTAKTHGDLAVLTRDLVPLRRQLERPPDGEDRLLAALVHASGYVTTFVGPLLFLLLSGKRSAYVRRHAAEALNFQITLLLVVALTAGVAGFLYLVTWIVCGIAAVSALANGRFRYPLTLRFIK
jgi:uncharacterized Tic20 family protein